MKFIIDAQLPKSLADFLNQTGHEALHTLSLPDKNRTTDSQIIEISVRENYLVITKNADFLGSYYLKKQPSKLILTKTGNLPNVKLLGIFSQHISSLENLITENSFIEIFIDQIIIHSDKG